jgi:TolA-binding protein
MRTRRLLASVAVVVSALPSLAGGCAATRGLGLGPDLGPWEAHPGDGPDDLYRKAEHLYGKGEWKASGELFGKVWKDHPTSRLAVDARFYEAETRYAMEKWYGAFELYKGFQKAQPLTPHAGKVQRRIYDMGVWVVEDGKSGGFLGIFDSSAEGIEMLEYLVEAFPNGELADDALLRIADYEWRHRRPNDAVIHLQDLLDRYPGSEWSRDARLRIAKAYRDMNRGSRYDADSLKRASAQYRAYIADVTSTPALAREYAEALAVARVELGEVESLLGQKGLEAADFYLYDGKADAARTELQNVIRRYPGTAAAAEAERRLGVEGGTK